MNTAKLKDIVRRIGHSTLGTLLWNLTVAYMAYFMCRVVYVAENWNLLGSHITADSLRDLLRGAFLFDTSAIFYTNGLYILLLLLPLHLKENRRYYKLIRWAYILPNAVAVVVNLIDAVLYSFRLSRMTALFFREFENESNTGSVLLPELVNHWYMFALGGLMVYALIRLYRSPEPSAMRFKHNWSYYVATVPLLLIVAYVAVCGVRGVWFHRSKRPVGIGEAHCYAHTPAQPAIILNTPFALLRTLRETPMKMPHYFRTQAELDSVFSPLHIPREGATERKRNVVVIIVESFGSEFIGALNRDLEGGEYRGYTPFTDSLIDRSMTFEQMLSNTSFSIDAMPAVFASIPRMDNPFVLTPFALNPINTIASTLREKGYRSAFFHGGYNESMGFQAFSRHAGFDCYYGRTEYIADTRFGGMDDFDGTWAIWDEEFLQFFATKLSEMPQPFVAGVFTASSHHPFNIPERYRDIYPEEGGFPIHKCIRYVDNALHLFFETASTQPWFENTVFVITADHTSSKITHDIYKTELGHFRAPIIFYDPSGDITPGQRPGIAQQTDVMPTLLDYLGYDRPYVAYGKSLLSTPPDSTWAFNWDRIPQYVEGDYLLQFDNERVVGLYNYKADPLLKHNLAGRGLPQEPRMTRRIQAIIQSYISRGEAKSFTP